MPNDILPPLPPGQKNKKLSKLKKKEEKKRKKEEKDKQKKEKGGFFGSKKDKAEQQVPLASYSPDAPNNSIDIDKPTTLDETRAKLGLDSDLSNGVPEPHRIKPTAEMIAEADLGEPFELPDIDAPENEKPAHFEDNDIKEPPKIGTKQEPKLKDEFPEPIPLPPELPPEPPDTSTDWKEDLNQDAKAKETSDFLSDVKNDEELSQDSERKEYTSDLTEKVHDKPESNEFVKDVDPHEVKELAENLKRKEFEVKKGIKYEPDVHEWIEEPEDPMVLEESPEEEMVQIKERLRHKLTNGLAPEEHKHDETPAEIPEPPKIDDKKEHGHKHEEKPPKPEPEPPKPEEKHEEPKRIEAVDISRIRDEVTNEITERIRKEETERVDKILSEERDKINNHKQELEQEKIRVAGRENKCDFREKQMTKEKEQFEKEREDYLNDKNEANELLEKLPMLRDDYSTLQNRMKEVHDQIKHNEDLLEELEEKRAAITEAEKRLIDEEDRIKKEGFADFVEDELGSAPLIVPKFKETDILKASNLELYNLIDSCKSHIRQNNMDGAKTTYVSLRDAYNNMNLKGAEKDMLYTAIRELYDDIKLAEMESNTIGF